MSCGVCCAQEKTGTLELDAPAQSDGAVLVEARPFDDAAPPPSAPEPEADADFLGKTVPTPPKEPEKGVQGVLFTRTDAFIVNIPMLKDQYPGFLLDVSGGPYLRMCKIETYGPLAEYHDHNTEDKHVMVGDFVVGVNRIKGDSEKMILALGAGGNMELDVRRAFEIDVQGLDKQGGSLGLDLSYRASSMSVVIKEVYEDGEVARWNQQQTQEEVKIKANDHIVAVNGKGGTSKFLVQTINENQRLDMLVTRPCSSANEPL